MICKYCGREHGCDDPGHSTRELEAIIDHRKAMDALISKNVMELVNAATDVIEQWDAPNWRLREHTGVKIARLRKAVDNV